MTSISGARSWLFAPGDSERKMEKAAAGPADVVLLDLEDAVAEDVKPRARAMISAFLAIHPAQVDVINAAFTPTGEELAEAQEIVDLFAAHPGAGTIGHKGAMLDRPHLARAQALLASRGRA
jgi:citrate lyase subunit beta/citryl-CoA lyase